jgi:hypothetical protein
MGVRVTAQLGFAATAGSPRASKSWPVSACLEFVRVGPLSMASRRQLLAHRRLAAYLSRGAPDRSDRALNYSENSCVLRRTRGRIIRPVTFRCGLDGQLAA